MRLKVLTAMGVVVASGLTGGMFGGTNPGEKAPALDLRQPEIAVGRLNLDPTSLQQISGHPLPGGGGAANGTFPGDTTYDLSHAVGTGALGFFLIFDPSLPGAPDDIVNFDGLPDATRTDVHGTVPTVTESDVAGIGNTRTITITVTSPPGTDLFPGGLTSSGFPLTDGGILLGIVEGHRLFEYCGSLVISASLEFFTDGDSVAGPFDVAGIVANGDGVWEGDFAVSIGKLAGFGVNSWTLIVEVSSLLFTSCPVLCPGDIAPPGGNGLVNIDDLVAVLNDFGSTGPPRTIGDVTPPCGNCIVNIHDVFHILDNFGQCLFGPGDVCPFAIVALTGANAFDSTVFHNTMAPGVNQCEFADPQLNDIWFIWTAPAGANNFAVRADLCGSTFDGALSIFPNDCNLASAGAFNALGCGDDNATGCPDAFQPEVNWIAAPGESYLLVASGRQGGGLGTLNIAATEITNKN